MSEDSEYDVTSHNYPKVLRGNRGTQRCHYKTNCKNL